MKNEWKMNENPQWILSTNGEPPNMLDQFEYILPNELSKNFFQKICLFETYLKIGNFELCEGFFDLLFCVHDFSNTSNA